MKDQFIWVLANTFQCHGKQSVWGWHRDETQLHCLQRHASPTALQAWLCPLGMGCGGQG